MMEECDICGLIYGIVPKNSKPVSGSSKNCWWKEKVKFDLNGSIENSV
jgi:hypothetical protein